MAGAALGRMGIYVPFEIYALTLGVSTVKIGLLLVNLALVAYLAMVLRATQRKRAVAAGLACRAPAECDTNVTKG